MKKVDDFVSVTLSNFRLWSELMPGEISEERRHRNPDGTKGIYTYERCRERLDEECDTALHFLRKLSFYGFCSDAIAKRAEDKITDAFLAALPKLFAVAVDKGLRITL